MDDTPKRRLDAEMKTEKIAQEASRAQQRFVQTALRKARAEDERLAASILELRHGFTDKAQERAEPTIALLKRRYEERQVRLRETGKQPGQEPLEAAFARFLDPRR